jgi:hypothetical protein
MNPRFQTDVVAASGAVLLVLATLGLARALTRISAVHDRLAASFVGGVSLAFVLLELFVELVRGTEHDLHVRAGPQPMHTIASLILLGASIAFAANLYGERHAESWGSYAIRLAPQIVYRMLVGAALDEELHTSPRAFAVFWVAMALHLGVAEHHLEVGYAREHRGPWRVAAAASPVIGAALWALAEPSSGTYHELLALLAGATMLSIFREEIPSAKEVHVGAFYGGIVLFGALVEARWWL